MGKRFRITQWTVSFWVGVAGWVVAAWLPALRRGAWLAHELVLALLAPVVGPSGVRVLDGAVGSALLAGILLGVVAAPGGLLVRRLRPGTVGRGARRFGVAVTGLVFLHSALWLQSATSVSARINPQPLRMFLALVVAAACGWLVAKMTSRVSVGSNRWWPAVASWSPGILAVMLVVARVGVGLDSGSSATQPVEPALVVGLDGAGWEQVRSLSDAGVFPALSERMGGGSGGPLSSIVPVLSPAAWTTVATGKRPWQHEIGGFLRGDELFERGDWRGRPIWSIAADAGLRVLVVNWYVTWPAGADDGAWVISDRFHVEGIEGGVWPASIASETDSVVAYAEAGADSVVEAAFGPPPSLEHDPVGAAAYRHLRREVHRDWAASRVALHWVQSRSWDLVFLYLRSTDGAQHRYWREHVEVHGPGWDDRFFRWSGRSAGAPDIDPVSECYGLADAWIAEVASAMGDATRILVVSDHGAGVRLGAPGRAQLNPLFVELGHLVVDADGEIRRPDSWLEDTTSPGDRRPLVRQVRVQPRHGSAESAALLLRGLVTREGDPVFARCEVRSDSLVDVGLARGLSGGSVVRLPSGEFFPVKKFSSVGIRGDFSGSHRIDGMYWSSEPRTGALARASLVDIAPTVLTWMGLPVGMDMEGHPLPLVAADDPVGTVRSHEVPYTTVEEVPSGVDDGSERIREDLKALGYLD